MTVPTTAAGPTISAGPTAPSGPGPGGRIVAWARTHPGMVVALLVPVVVLGVAQLFGGTFVTGDNLIQNLPLRFLVGQDLDHGILPLWNPYLFSGTPLLGGFNAGAAYPVTWLTAVLPLFTVWTITVALAYDVALVGMYLLLRRQPLSVTAATFGAVTFAFAGYMTAQFVHIDLLEGASWLPWMLVAVHALTGRPEPGPSSVGERAGRRRRIRGWVVVLSLALGMSLLSGNSEAVIDSAVLVAVYWVSRLVSTGLLRRDARRALASSVAAVLAGLVGGIALGAAQWLPGLVFLSQSQRSSSSYNFFSSGSLDNRLLPLEISPFLLGTNQNVPGMYAGGYNLPEVTGYMGILALIAACSLFLRRWRTRPEARHWWIWYVVLVLGVLSAMGGDTPFGRLMYAVPGINAERLTNRNLLLVDLALAALVGWWVHVLLTDRAAGAGAVDGPTTRGLWRPGRRAETVVTCLPVAAMAALAIFLWIDGPLLGRIMDIQYPMSSVVRMRVAGVVSVQVVVAAGATWIVLVERRFSARTLTRLLTAALTVDLVLFNLMIVQPPISEAQAKAEGPASAAFRSAVGDGRFIIYDPDRLYGDQLLSIGQTDLNTYGSLPSAQGYTALTDGGYVAATGAHYQEVLNPETLAGTVWDGLNVTTLVSVPGYFVTPVPATGAEPPHPPLTLQLPSDPAGYQAAPKPAPTTVTLAPGTSHRWYFGGVLTVGTWQVPVLGGSGPFRVGLVTATGGLRWLPAADATVTGAGAARALRVTMAQPTPAGGIVVQSARSSLVGVPEADTVEGGTVALDGRMQFWVDSAHWEFSGTLGPFGLFRNADRQGWAHLTGVGGGAAPRGSAVTAAAPGPGGSSTVSVVTPSPAVLVRSAAWSPGWGATVRSVDDVDGRPVLGPPTSEPVTRDGVLQQVAIPSAGRYRVSFAYAPAPARIGILVSGLATAALVVLGLLELVGARRRRRRAPV